MGQARDLVERWWSLYDGGVPLDEALRLGHPDVELVMPGGMGLHGPEEIAAVLGAFREALPDSRHVVVDAVEAGDKIALEVRATGTHTGVFRTPQGEVPPTGRTIVIESVDFVTVRDGLIASWHTYFDQFAFLAQLGLLPEPASA